MGNMPGRGEGGAAPTCARATVATATVVASPATRAEKVRTRMEGLLVESGRPILGSHAKAVKSGTWTLTARAPRPLQSNPRTSALVGNTVSHRERRGARLARRDECRV